MALLHFAFGQLHREARLDEQLDKFIELILLPKKLQGFPCPEFLPFLPPNPQEVWRPASASVDAEGFGAIDFARSNAILPVDLLPEDVWMVSFVDIALRKLPAWVPSVHYGHIGLAFTDAFRKRLNVKRVSYYKFEDLARDPLVIKHSIDSLLKRKVDDTLRALLLEFRKPARLTNAFREASTVGQIGGHPGGPRARIVTYDRYPIGYDFTAEQEARIVVTPEMNTVSFSPKDVLSIIVHSEDQTVHLRERLSSQWDTIPPIVPFPQ